MKRELPPAVKAALAAARLALAKSRVTPASLSPGSPPKGNQE